MKNIYALSLIFVCSLILMSGIVDLNVLFDYANQGEPDYISKDNTPQDNAITDAGATLGRVLFYDKNLSIDNTISCASCHHQEFAFGDTAIVSTGVNGVTGRHSMRLVNLKFSDEIRAFWDERAISFEAQATIPIQDHIEMGYSGENGDSSFEDLITKLEGIEYYHVLFKYVFGDPEITEIRIQKAIAQFERSIQSYDSKYDVGRAQVNNDQTDFPNYTEQENIGKDLFFKHPPLGGAGCARCHSGPEFSIIQVCNNNGVIGVANDTSMIDLTNTKAPSLRNLVNPQGVMGPFMHDGSLATLMDVIEHYNQVKDVPENTQLDFRLAGSMHELHLKQDKKEALVAFLHTLTGKEIYTAEKWSNPFDEEGNISVIPFDPNATTNLTTELQIELFPNPVTDKLIIKLDPGEYQMVIYNENGTKIKSSLISAYHVEDVNQLAKGVYFTQFIDLSNKRVINKKIIIQ